MRLKWNKGATPRGSILFSAVSLGVVMGAATSSGVSFRSIRTDSLYLLGVLAIAGIGLALMEICLRRQQQNQENLDKNLLDALLHYVPDNIFFKDVDSRFLRMSRAMAEHCNLVTPQQALEKTDAALFSEEHARRALADEQQVIRTGKPLIDKEEKETWPDGRESWVLTAKVPVKDHTGKIIATMGIVHDITERKEAELRLKHTAEHDALTGLANRALFEEKLETALAETRTKSSRAAILVLDLDRFRSVNDSLGHCAGDYLLKAVAQRLQEKMPAAWTVARIGGDEFALIVPDISEDGELERLPAKVQEFFSEPFRIGKKEIRIGTGMGIALYPENGHEGDNLLRFANLALYEAKRKGCGRHSFFSPSFSVITGHQHQLESDILQASARDEFVLNYQPFVDAASGRITGVEALLRWQHPEYGVIAPGQFIPLLEKLGLMQEVGRWALRAACYQAVEWQHMGLGAIRMAVNVSSQQFVEDNIVDSVLEVLTEAKMDPGMLELELTESQVLDDSEATLNTLRRLKKIGVSLALDDFGTGWSSLAYLRRFPLDRLKIGGTLVRDVGSERTAEEVVKSVLGLAKTLNLSCIAEEVETVRQYEILRNMGCTEMQGYYFSRPIGAVQATALLRSAKGGIYGGHGEAGEAGVLRIPIDVAREASEAVSYNVGRVRRR